jgi:hypothetical protein
MRKSARLILVFVPCALGLALAGSSSAASAPSENDLYAGWLKMYDLKFDEAHSAFAAWKQSHPKDSLGPASNASAFLFSELARLGALESELFVDDSRFKDRAKLRRLVQVNPEVADAYLGPGLENYLLSLKSALHTRFPHNELYTREMNRIDKGAR